MVCFLMSNSDILPKHDDSNFFVFHIQADID